MQKTAPASEDAGAVLVSGDDASEWAAKASNVGTGISKNNEPALLGDQGVQFATGLSSSDSVGIIYLGNAVVNPEIKSQTLLGDAGVQFATGLSNADSNGILSQSWNFVNTLVLSGVSLIAVNL